VPSAVSADQTSGLSVPSDTLPPMSNAAPWAVIAGNKFREVARSIENPTTKLLAGGLTALAEAVREVDQEVRQRMTTASQPTDQLR
jgi:hypothetical protein